MGMQKSHLADKHREPGTWQAPTTSADSEHGHQPTTNTITPAILALTPRPGA